MATNDCQQDHLVVHLPEGDSVVGADLPLLGPIADLPEYHDCQRLLAQAPPASTSLNATAGGMEFGPLVAIWAANRLDEVFQGTDRLMAVPVAIIYNFDPSRRYDSLDIEPGFSCLYLWNDGRLWHAQIQWIGKDARQSAECQAAKPVNNDMVALSQKLHVEPAALLDGLTAADIPSVVRWDWDARNEQQYIDIRCGDQWCQVGRAGFAPAKSAFNNGMTLAKIMALPDINDRAIGPDPERVIKRVFAVKGWYDEQRMDLPPAAANEAPRMAAAAGIAFPHPTLDRATFEAGAWTTVAYLSLSANYDGAVRLRQGISRLQMCHGDAEQCQAGGKSCSEKEQDSHDRWWGRTISETGDTSAVGCVRRRGHEGSGAIPAAAARWNWSELDARTWVQCTGGCCVLS